MSATYASMLRVFSPVDVLIAIRAAVLDPPAPRPTSLAYDPWFADDPFYLSAWAGVVPEVPR